jgi:hypothetical protein
MQNGVGFFQFLLFFKMREPRGECLRSLYCLKHVFFFCLKTIFNFLGKKFPEAFLFSFAASYLLHDSGMYTCTVFILRNQKRFCEKKLINFSDVTVPTNL